MPCNSPACVKLTAIVQRLIADHPNVTWLVFDADTPDDQSVFIRFYPGKVGYVYDLIVGQSAGNSAEQEIRRFIDANIPA